MRHFFYTALVFFVLICSLSSCARRGRPTGGDKDSIPPLLLKAEPAVETVNFKEKKIKIYFDEYIKLKDVNKKLVISPPQKYDPVITPVGTASKFISIKILDTLDANTTYSYNFGNSIVDNNEGNELGNFKYVFSTGTYIDSLNVTGNVTDSSVNESITNVDVMLYEYDSIFTDSIIYKEKPRYLANTLDSTLFDITNIREGKYLLIALMDKDGNKIYDPKKDKIGFVKDTLTMPTDEKFDFTVFMEIPEFDVVRPTEDSKGHILFGYEGDPKGMNVELLSETPDGFRSEVNFESTKDTLNYWYTGLEADSLNFKVTNEDYSKEFTVRLRSSKIDSLKIEKSTNSVLHLLDTFSISSNTPIVQINPLQITIRDQDSILIDFNTILSDSKTKLYLNFDKKHNTNYNFELLPNTVRDLFGFANDSLFFQLKTKSPDDYGSISLDLKSEKETSFIVELLDKKEKVLRTIKVDQPQIVSFNLLNPGEYLIRTIIDENNNGIWDTGSFLNKRQPETIIYFHRTVNIRANRDENEIFDLK